MTVDLAATLGALGSLLGAIAWPMTVLVVAVVLRQPLSRSLEGIGARVTRVSVGQLAVDLATVKAPAAWTIGDTDLRRPTAAVVIDLSSVQLFQQMSDTSLSDYAVIDVGRGDQWLTSRLFLFAVFLQRMKGLRSFVFVDESGGAHRRFLAMASPDGVRWSLARRYPMLEHAWAQAYSANVRLPVPGSWQETITSTSGAIDPVLAVDMARTFLEGIQSGVAPLPPEEGEWIALPDTAPPKWERARWIDGNTLERDLRDVLDRDSWLIDAPDDSSANRAQAILRRKGAYVAMLAPDQRFKELIDRQALLEKVGLNLAEAS